MTATLLKQNNQKYLVKHDEEWFRYFIGINGSSSEITASPEKVQVLLNAAKEVEKVLLLFTNSKDLLNYLQSQSSSYFFVSV